MDKSKSTTCTVQGCVQKNNIVKGGRLEIIMPEYFRE